MASLQIPCTISTVSLCAPACNGIIFLCVLVLYSREIALLARRTLVCYFNLKHITCTSKRSLAVEWVKRRTEIRSKTQGVGLNISVPRNRRQVDSRWQCHVVLDFQAFPYGAPHVTPQTETEQRLGNIRNPNPDYNQRLNFISYTYHKHYAIWNYPNSKQSQTSRSWCSVAYCPTPLYTLETMYSNHVATW